MRPGLFDLRRIAGAKSTVDPKQGSFVLRGVGHEVESLHCQRVQDQWVTGILDNKDLLDG